jgi:hypothetical protein
MFAKILMYSFILLGTKFSIVSLDTYKYRATGNIT